MARPTITRTSFRIPEALVEKLAQDPRVQANASAMVRATLDAFIAFDGRIRPARELNVALRCKVAATPVTLSCLHREMRHYRRFARAQGHTFGALVTTALCAAYGLPAVGPAKVSLPPPHPAAAPPPIPGAPLPATLSFNR